MSEQHAFYSQYDDTVSGAYIYQNHDGSFVKITSFRSSSVPLGDEIYLGNLPLSSKYILSTFTRIGFDAFHFSPDSNPVYPGYGEEVFVSPNIQNFQNQNGQNDISLLEDRLTNLSLDDMNVEAGMNITYFS